ncbi:hypothetical protein D3C86_1798140 [compost metagenome]
MRARVASITPSQSPRQPAWAAPTTVPAASHSNTGRQSAVMIAQTWPGVVAMLASARGTPPSPPSIPSAVATAQP